MKNVYYKGGIDHLPTNTSTRAYAAGLFYQWTPEEIFELPHTVQILMDVAARHRCSEIVSFAAAAQIFSRRSSHIDLDELFEEYIHLVGTYIAPYSKLEINISQCCRDHLMKYTVRSNFDALPAKERLQLFFGAYKEVHPAQWAIHEDGT